MKRNIIVKEAEIPEVEKPNSLPVFSHEDYEERYRRLKDLMLAKQLDYVVIYGDMGQFVNIHFFTGVDLKFEQALLIIGMDNEPVFLLGNEFFISSRSSPYKKLSRVLFQPFSLQGQPYDESVNLKDIFLELGIKKSDTVGVIGNKYYPNFSNSDRIFDSPQYIIDTLIDIVGIANLKNTTDIMTDCQNGLRNNLSPKEIVFMESAERFLCFNVKKIMKNLKIGINEVEAANFFDFSSAIPFSVPIIFGFGDKAIGNLAGPIYSSVLKKSDPIYIGFGLWGALVARSGLAVSSTKDYSEHQRNANVLDNFFIPYFRAIVEWYENVRVGCTGGDVFRAIEEFIDNPAFGVGLNPGHLIHWDEWTNSPFYRDSKDLLHSGMAIQCDIISHHKDFDLVLTLEDGIILADDVLQKELIVKFPDFMKRVEKRRSFLKNVLGIDIDNTVLPLSDIQAILHPYFLNQNLVFAVNN
ncbi:MAG: hypothetical protein M1371_07470 [Actinobacteria bacterium]|nr:hypothetical protein [Actinomycetota bacterium]